MRYTLFKRVFLFWMVLTAALGVAKAQIYQIGDVYVFPDSSKGIICYVNPDNPVEGWAVALNDVGWVSKTNNQQYYMINAGCTLPSGMENHLYDNNAGIGRYGLSEWTYEGKNNTHLLLESGQSPAAEAVDFYNGWYIPDAIQMRHIFGLLPFIESAIVEAGGDPNGVKWMYEYNNNHGHDYWTSTRVNGNQMLVVRGSQYFYNPRTPADHSVALNSNNSTKNCIRAVRDFGTDAYAYWVDKPKSASMTVNPTVNTSYDAYVIFNSDTIRVTSSAIVHEKYDKDTLYEVVCSSPNPYTSVVNPNFTDLDISHVQDYTPYRVTLQTVHGCDSIITLMLKVNPSYEFTESAFICQNAAPYLWRGRTLNASGVYYDTLKTVCCDCDSVYVLNLTVAPLPEMTITPEHPVMCAGGSVELSASAINCSDYSEPLTENFEGVTGTDQDITSSLSTLTDFFNSGQKVFSAGNGVVRLGTGSVFGQIVSKPLDLSEDFTLDLSMKGWIRTGSSEPAATRVRVAVDDVYADTVTVQGSNQNNPGSFETYSLNFNAATASSVIKIEAIDEVAPGSPYAEERFYIDFMRISDNSPCGFEWYDGNSLLSSASSVTVHPVATKEYYVEVTSSAGCKKRDTVEVDVHDHFYVDTFATACNSFTWHGQTYTTSGNYERWLTCQAGCDSVVTLHLTIVHSNTGDTTAFACGSFDWYEHTNITSSTNALTHTFTNASGCDSVVTLHLTVGHSNTGDTTAFACDSFDWYEHHNITSSTNALTHTFTNASGCDSVVTLHLTVGHSNTGDTTAFACDRFDWYEHTNITSSTESLTHTFTNASGCDSVVTLHLTVGHSNTGDTTAFACNSFDWYEHTNITSSTDALTHTFTNASGCDSVVTLHLTVGNIVTGDTTAFACGSFDWYEHHNITSSTDALTHTFTNASGCDSVVTLHLTVGYSNTGDTTAFACDSFDWYEHTNITSSTDALTHTFTNASGCDSVVTLHLTVGHSNTGDTTAFACNRFDWYEHTNITSSTDALTHTFTNASGCDSVVTLHLTVGHSNTGDTTAFACNRFDWYEHTNITSSTDALTHTFTNASGCDSVVTLHLTVGHSNTGDTTAFACNSFDWYEHHNITFSTDALTHTFTNASGCDSVVTLHLTVGHSNTGDTTAFACDRFDWYEHTNITSSTNSLTHTFTNASGCDSVVTLHLTVGHSNTGDTTAFACDRFDWYEHTNITYSTDALTHTFTNASGCDSVVTLHLTVGHSNTGDTTAFACNSFDWYEHHNITSSTDALTHTFTNASGCDSVVTLHLTVGHSNTGDTTAFSCVNFTWYGTTYTSTPFVAPTHTFTNASGCDSVVTLHLTIGDVFYGDTTAFACNSFDWYEHHNITSSTNSLTHMFTSVNGCDSLVTLHLTVGHSNTGDTTAFACDRFDWYEHTNITSSTDALTHTFTNASGCDSVVTLHLTVGHSNTGDTTAFACNSFDWYEHSNITSSTDALTHTFTNASGCDSVVTLHLTVGHSNTGDTTAFACNSFDWYEHHNITSSTDALTHTFTNASGCDSVVTLHLTVGHSNTGDTTAFACDRFDWYEHTKITSSTNSLTHTFTNASGCDSVVTLHLTVGHSNTGDTTAFACDRFDWYEHHNITSSTNSLTHTFTNASGCDSVVRLHLTVGHSNTGDTTAFACNRFDWYEHHNITSSTNALTHTFTNASGCDSVVTLHLTVGHSNTGDTTAFACDRFDWYEHHNITSSTDALTHTFTNASGCDSVVTLHLTVGHSNTGDTTAFACDRFDWYEHTNITSSTDALTHAFTNASGCDSVVTLHLTVGHSNTGDTTAFACNSFDWYEHHNITSSTNALTHTFTNASGCDSVVTLHLTVGHSNTGDTTAFACDRFDWYEHTNITSSTDALTHTFTNASGCDSVVTLHLTVGHSNTGDTTAFACDRFDWYEHTNITSSTNSLTHTFTNASGCDSVVTLHLTVGHSNTGDTTAFACDRFDWYEHSNITSSTDALTHTFTNASGCDSVVTLHLTVGHSNTGDTTAFACDRFDWYEHTNITSSTNSLTHTFTNASGCDSVVTLHLTVGHSNTGDTTAFACDRFDWYEHTNITSSTNSLTHTFTNASGCDSVVTLHLTIGLYNTSDTTAFACDRFDWYEHTNITSSTNSLTHTFTNASGCDSVVTLHLTVGHSNTGDTTAFACNSFDWYEHHNITSSTDALTHTFTNASGCDSVVTLHLTVGHSNTGDTTAFACNRFDWYEHTNITSSTDALTHTFTNASGCDSVVTLHLTVGHSNTGDTTAFACDRFDWYEHTNITSSTDALTHTFTNASGCDSVVTLHLTVGHSNTGDTTAFACDRFDWYEHTNITSSTDALTHTFTNASGCDSVVTLHLIVHHPVHQAITRTACESFDWNGTTYYSSGTYTYSHPCEHGCMQVDTLHLTVNYTTYGDTTAVECGSFTWHGITYKSTPATAPTYTIVGGNHVGCDSVVTLHLTILPAYVTILEETVHSGTHFPFMWNGINITGPGNYTYKTTASNGCDSTVKINFVIQGCDIKVTPTVTNEICGNDGTITVAATGGYSGFYYSVDAGVNFYTSPVFTGLSAGFYVVVAHDDFGCYSVGYGVVHPSHGLAISCPPDVNDVLDFGECEMEIPTADISEPTVNATNINLDVSHYPPTTVSGTWTYPTLADWPAYTVTSDKPTDNMYAEGDNVITWTVNDPVCGPKTCQQHVYVTFPECPDAIDCEGNVYHGIRIDCDCWTQTNLKSTRYSDCSLIPTVYEYYSSMTPDVAENVERFGRLYSFESAVRDSADNGHGHIQGICPAGWYLPTPEKYETLSLHGADALKSPMYWLDGGGSNTTGFSALPAGWYNGSRDRYEGMYGETYFWSTKGVGATTESSAYGLIFNCDTLFKAEDRSGVGYSIRCIKEKN